MHMLDDNEDVKILFISSGKSNDNGAAFADLLIKNLMQITRISEYNNEEAEIYLSFQNDNMKDAFVLTSLMETIRSMPGNRINVVDVIMTESSSAGFAAPIYDDTEKLSVSDLLTGARAFLQYGKTDMLLDFRDGEKLNNPEIDRILYAMRNIDIGISLCDITDIERGINSLKAFFADEHMIEGESFAEKYFNVIAGGIKQDYGPLLTGDKIEFIDLVKWAYRKKFWQQTLTLIESGVPQDFVEKGIFYYCDSPESRQDVVRKFGKLYYDLKPYEKYKLEDVAHYYVKFYNRWRMPRSKTGKEYQLGYAQMRVRELKNDDEDIITAYTMCPDTDALEDLLFAYYYLGDVRNATNHAVDEFDGFVSVMHDSDVGERMNMISRAIDYFIHCFDRVRKLIDQDAVSEIIQIDPAELAAYGNTIRNDSRSGYKGKN